jgi:hypothetical protein
MAASMVGVLPGILPAPLRSCHDSILSRAGASTDPGGIQHRFRCVAGSAVTGRNQVAEVHQASIAP